MSSGDIDGILQFQLDRQRRTMLEEVDSYERHYRGHSLEILRLTAQIEEEQERTRGVQAEINTLRIMNDGLQVVNERMLASRSWRITKPLRLIIDLTRSKPRP